MTARRNIGASVLARLRNVAAGSELSFNDILQAYVIERAIFGSTCAIAAGRYGPAQGRIDAPGMGVPRARPTMDIDFLRRGIADQAGPRALFLVMH